MPEQDPSKFPELVVRDMRRALGVTLVALGLASGLSSCGIIPNGEVPKPIEEQLQGPNLDQYRNTPNSDPADVE